MSLVIPPGGGGRCWRRCVGWMPSGAWGGLVTGRRFRGGRLRLLVAVDQFQDLLTQATLAARRRFAELLPPVLGGPVRLVATLRPEFLDQLLVDTGLAVLPTRPYPLRALRREALPGVIQ